MAGLTTALLLSKNKAYNIVVAAKHMPGDYDIEYASPWAGANYMPSVNSGCPFARLMEPSNMSQCSVSVRGTKAADWDKETWAPLEDLARNHPEAGVHFQGKFEHGGLEHSRRKLTGPKSARFTIGLRTSVRPLRRGSPSSFRQTRGSKTCCQMYRRHGLLGILRSVADYAKQFRLLPKSSLEEGVDSATAFTSVCINTAIYLPWLISQCLKNGVVFKRAIFAHISDASRLGVHPSGKAADLVVNCTGLMASKLGGVEDKTVIPARGQIVIVRNVADKMVDVSGTDDGDSEACYVMTRAAGGGTILGGSYQLGNTESQPDPNLAVRIMKRAVKLCPSLTNGKGIEHLDIIRHGVGLRPVRTGGTRIEKERIDGVWIVHNYGAGGAGYQSSYGCAQSAVELVEEALSPRSKL